MLKFVNFSEKEILDRFQKNSHLGQGIERLKFKTVRCTKDYEYQGKLIYQKRKEYKLWIVKYSDVLNGTSSWFTAQPKVIDEDIPQAVPCKDFYMVPLEVFEYAGNSLEVSPFFEHEEFCGEGVVKRYQLFVDVNDGMQKLINPWSLNKSEVVNFAVQQYGGSVLDYTIRGRLVTNPRESHIVWLLRKRLGRKQYLDLFFDVLEQEFIRWDMYAPDAKLLPISSGQAMVHIGHNTVKADKYGFIYRLGNF